MRTDVGTPIESRSRSESKEDSIPGYRTWESIKVERIASGDYDPVAMAEASRQLLASTRGYRLLEKREWIGLDSSALAEMADLDETTVADIERGEVEHLDIAAIRAYVEALGVKSR